MDSMKNNVVCVCLKICIFSLFSQLFEFEKRRQSQKEIVLERSDGQFVILVKKTSVVAWVNRNEFKNK